jgi:hypothetical protein
MRRRRCRPGSRRGLGLVAAPAAETTPARNLALIGAAMETAASERMEHRIAEGLAKASNEPGLRRRSQPS